MFLRIYPAFSRYLFIAAGICVLSAMIAPCAPAAGLSWKIQLVNGEQCLENQDFPGAEACFRYALKDVRKTRNATPAEIACCLQSLAGVFQKENDTEDAIPLYKKALCVLEKAHGKDSTKIVPVLFTLADIFESEGVYKTAVTFYSRAVSIEEKNKNQPNKKLNNGER